MTERPEGETDDPGTLAPADRSEPDDHRTDGLDLARSIARAYRGVAGQPAPRRRKRRPRPTVGSSGAHPDDRDPQTLASTLGRLVSEHGWETEVAVHGVFGRWREIVGDEVAGHCTPTRYDEGVLRVEADSTAWATQLRLLAPNVVAKLNERLGDGTVTRIDVRGPQAPSWRKGSLRVQGRGPRDTYG